ncbi:MAG: gamma-glutamyltransferase [Dermatophilaceae bacterium]
MKRRVALAAPGPSAVDAGIAVARAGGNAVDAAIAAIVVASCTEPGIVSPMGGAYVNVWAPGEGPYVVDGNVEMPGRGREPERFGGGVWDVYMEYGGGTRVFGGPGSVAVPGMLAALSEASTRWGRLPWLELLVPAAHVLRTGFPLGTAAAYYLTYSRPELFGQDPETVTFLRQCGVAPTAGALLRAPDLAATLDRIGREGAADLYTGELGHALATDMDARGGLVSAEDLAAYQVVTRQAVRCRLGDWALGVNPPPSIGGPALAAMVRLLQIRHQRVGTTDAHDVIDIQRLVLAYRRARLDGAEALEQAGAELLSVVDDQGAEGLAALATSPETVHVSAVDSDGLACAITTSAGYGSGVTVPGTGLMLNNALGEPELNTRGLHALPPGRRLPSNMAPTTGRRDDGAMLAIGSPGADRITTSVFQVLDILCLHHLPLQEAIDAPRLHVELDADAAPTVRFERAGSLPQAVEDSGLRSLAHEPVTMWFGGVGATLLHPDGRLDAAADPRRAAAVGIS